MAYFDISENPVYSEQIRKFEETDPGHADVFNDVVEKLVDNDAFLKNATVQLQEQTVELTSGKVDKTGDTMTGKLYLEQGSSVFVSNDNGDFDTGYIKIATITWNSLSTGYRLPISLTVNKRYGYTPITMSLYFFTASNEATRKSPLLRAWSFGETKTDVYVINPNGDWMTWEIYLNAYDGLNNNFVEIVDFKDSKVGSDHYVVEFHKNTYVETLPEGVRAETAVSNVLGRIDELGQKMAAIEAVWPHVMWDTGGWNPFTETAPASVINDKIGQNQEAGRNEN